MATPEPLLEVRGLSAGYSGRPVVFDVDLDVRAGEVVTLLGANGAGKTTVLNSIVGLVRPLAGSIHLGGDVWNPHPHRAVKAGLGLVPAERFTFPGLTVAESLALGSRNLSSAAERKSRHAYVLDLFPKLAERLGQRAETMSGGEQRMLSVAVALLAGPRLLLLDEPSLGLAPAVAEHLIATLGRLATVGQLGILMVEQNVHQALSISSRAYVLRSGRVIRDASASEIRETADWWSLF